MQKVGEIGVFHAFVMSFEEISRFRAQEIF